MNHSQSTNHWARKFSIAFRGVAVGIRGQSSFKVHIPMAIIVLAAGLILKLDAMELAVVLMCIGSVITAELFNSGLEAMAKAITSQTDDNVRDALDIASGAVLVISICSAAVGGMVIGGAFLAFFE